VNYPTPHFEKLQAVLKNAKLPPGDKAGVEQALEVYLKWKKALDTALELEVAPEAILTQMIQLLNDYKLYVDVELIFDSPSDFLYRQKGQLKLDNSVIEEFLPRLMNPIFLPEIQQAEVTVGPIEAFSAVYFESSLDAMKLGGGLKIRTKNQDFAISKPLFLKASHSRDFNSAQTIEKKAYLAYVAAECKTNLDKTMFQEACATAHDVKSAVPGAKYFLLCEWLDMTPVSTAPTDVDEVLILRKAKRLGSNVRRNFDTFAGRQNYRTRYIEYLKQHPLKVEVFQRFIDHVRNLLSNEGPDEKDVLSLGYF
jgi:hypothetical protein